MVGYAEDHTPDTYRLYNPQANKVIMSRDVSWASWNKTDPSENMEQYADVTPEVPLDDPNQTTTEPNDNNNHEPTEPHIIPPEPNDTDKPHSLVSTASSREEGAGSPTQTQTKTQNEL